jgi:uncharacterized membrane protein YcfT
MLMSERSRIAWADVAKGMCILLVVLWRSSGWWQSPSPSY